jgi:hypothetical protein
VQGRAWERLVATWPTATRALVAAVMLAPLAFCMGLPLPLTQRELEEPLCFRDGSYASEQQI